ncbi:MAG TPA: CRISPR-associated protein [Solibacterales bacterium]|nr:CRISPR-associated protein [Bryobacterales bacterium]
MALLAHSGDPKRGVAPQEYTEHVSAVRAAAVANAKRCLGFRRAPHPSFQASVEWAATFHDLGKLHPENQRTLGTSNTSPLPFNHVDAGVAHLILRGFRDAAIAAFSHHVGLVDLPEERAKRYRQGEAPFRDNEISPLVDHVLPDLLKRHRAAGIADPSELPSNVPVTGLESRLILSCLVDADHSDTARHYDSAPEGEPLAGRWSERLDALDRYIETLSQRHSARTALRSAVYRECRAADTSQLITACDSPVGSGKTTAVMAYLLKAALDLDLRHVFVVLPFTNLIDQSVNVYRSALSLPGEDPEEVVAAHHHLAEFGSREARGLSICWRSPVIVTTAVQFFETLSAAGTAKLRKLHELPGSAAFIDEAHAAAPVYLWPFLWRQMEELAESWRCRFVLGSGSLARFWENPRINPKRPAVPMLVPPLLASQGDLAERRRVEFRACDQPFDLPALAGFVRSQPGPSVVVMNTVQSAAVLARRLRDVTDVFHLSTALAPQDRGRIVAAVRRRLQDDPNGPWFLIATSCVEAGLEFDFATGFRERSRAAGLVQLGGRVNRHGARAQSVVWDFVAVDPMFAPHPDFEAGRSVVQKLFEAGAWNSWDTTRLMTTALEWELMERGIEERVSSIQALADAGRFATLAKETRVISAATKTVVVDPELCTALRGRRSKVPLRTLLAGSVQLWSNKIGRFRLEPVPGLPEVYSWDYEYDPSFLGIMQGALRLIEGDRDGYILI